MHIRASLLFLIIVSLAACSRTRSEETVLHHESKKGAGAGQILPKEEVSRWRDLRDAGISAYQARRHSQAASILLDAFRLKPADPATLLFLGLTFEAQNLYGRSVAFLRYLATLDIPGTLKQELTARIQDNQDKAWQKEIQANLQRMPTGAFDLNSLAVLYFRNLSSWQELAPLIKGFAELLVHDLEKVRNLQVRPRRQIEILNEEMNVSPAQLYDRKKMTEIARILGTAFLVTGSVERLSETRIKISTGVVDGRTGQLVGAGAQFEGQLSDILQIEKQVAFGVVKDLGIRLSPEEKRAMQIMPTDETLAFIAFGRALDLHDRKMLADCKEQYALALEHDRNFKFARRFYDDLQVKRLTLTELENIGLRSR